MSQITDKTQELALLLPKAVIKSSSRVLQEPKRQALVRRPPVLIHSRKISPLPTTAEQTLEERIVVQPQRLGPKYAYSPAVPAELRSA